MPVQFDPVDAEEALSRDLSSAGFDVKPPPVPDSLGDELPFAIVERDGGVRVNAVMDSHDVTFSIWASTWSEAVSRADALAGAVARLPSTAGTVTQWRTAGITALPFNAPDPRHPSIPRVQFTAAVTCRPVS